MRKDKDEALNLRRMGKSYQEISVVLNIPKSTLSDWLGKADWSKNITTRLTEQARVLHTARIIKLGQKRGEKLREIYEEARVEAIRELEMFKYHPLFIAGLMLYWGGGDKVTSDKTRLINTDPAMIRIFTTFLKDICGVPKEDIRAALLVYPDLDEPYCREYWAKESGIDASNFRKSTVIKGRHLTKRVGWGMCTVYVSSTYLKVKMKEWLNKFPNQLMMPEYYASI